jgi:hypothetical protein
MNAEATKKAYDMGWWWDYGKYRMCN